MTNIQTIHLVFVLVISSVFSGSVRADDLQFDSIRLNELAKVGYTQILSDDLIVDDAFNADNRQLSVYLKDRNRADIGMFLKYAIERHGYDVAQEGKLIKISKREGVKKPDLVPFFYKPKYREVSYLTDMVSNIFEVGSFTFNRGVKNPSAKGSDVPDTGSTAFSQLSKPLDAFIFNGTEKEVKKLTQLLDVLDTPQHEVNVQAYIYEVSNTNGQSQTLSLAANLLGGKLKSNFAVDALSSFISIKTFGLSAIFSALSTDSRFKVVSSPSLRVKDRETAKFSVGADVPILGAITQNNGVTTQSVDYKQSGVILEVTPKIRENVVELKIDQELSNFIQTNTGVNNSPTLLKRGLSTTVTAQNDEVIIMGGLDEEKATSGSSGFPLLPIFARNNSRDNAKSNILLVLHVQLL